MTNSAFLTVDEASAELGRSVATVRRWSAEGKIAAQKVGKQWLVRSDAIANLKARALPRSPAASLGVDLRAALRHIRSIDLSDRDIMIPDILRFQDQLVDSVSLLGSAAQVLSGEIELSPAPEVELPKSPFFTRTVLMLSLEDRVAYQAAVASFADRADRNIPANVYGGRRSNDPDLFLKDGVTQWLAWKERVKTDLENYPWMIKTDITAYFDALQHSVLFGAIEAHNPDPRILEALRRMLRAWTVAPSQGIPQGPNASRFLQNVYFLPIDQEMIAGPWRYYRFIDDIRILGHTRAEPKAGLKILERECKRRGLVLSVQKTKLLEGEDAVRDWDDAEIDAASYLMRVGRQKEARRHLRRILSRAIRGRGDLDGRQARFSLWRLMILRDDRALRTVLSDIEDLGPLSSR